MHWWFIEALPSFTHQLAVLHLTHPQESGQFERTLLIADEDSYVSYLEGCTVEALRHEKWVKDDGPGKLEQTYNLFNFHQILLERFNLSFITSFAAGSDVWLQAIACQTLNSLRIRFVSSLQILPHYFFHQIFFQSSNRNLWSKNLCEAAVVELHAAKGAEIKCSTTLSWFSCRVNLVDSRYSTVQNWCESQQFKRHQQEN